MPADAVMRGLSALACAVFLMGAKMTATQDVTISSAAVLQAKYSDLADQLDRNAFGRPLVLESSDTSGNLKGNVYAVLGHPYARVQAELKQPRHWCDILILHLNTKYCRAESVEGATVLNVNIGRKSDQPIEQSFRVVFAFRVADATATRLAVLLESDKGPFGTRDYRIMLEAVPIAGGKTFMHLAYSYSYGTAAKLGLTAYLHTAGSGKVGFTVTGRTSRGEAIYIDGLRGLVERNTMRYFLAIESYLGALSVPAPEQLEKRLADWYAAVERYPRQLHEIEGQAYLEMKRREYRRQQSPL